MQQTLLIILAVVLGSAFGFLTWYLWIRPLQHWLLIAFFLLYALARSKKISQQMTVTGNVLKGMVRALQGQPEASEGE